MRRSLDFPPKRRPNPRKLQDVFIKIHTHIGNLRESDKLQSWIFQIARNTIADFYRTNKFISELQEVPYVPEDPFDDDVSGLLPYVKKLVENLPNEYREALLLTEYEGLNQRELAERLGISISGAKFRVQRAREKVRLMLLDCCHFQCDRRGRIINLRAELWLLCEFRDCATACK